MSQNQDDGDLGRKAEVLEGQAEELREVAGNVPYAEALHRQALHLRRLDAFGVTASGRPAPRAQLPHPQTMSSVMILDALMPALEVWLHSRGCFLARFPGDDAEFTEYTVSPGDALCGQKYPGSRSWDQP